MHSARLKLYVRSLGSAYGLLVVNTFYALASIPLALHYLGKSVFGLWALTVQIGIVLRLADAGLSSALARILIDYKDDREGPDYRQTLYSVWLALMAIGAIVGFVAFGCRHWIMELLSIPPEFAGTYPQFLGGYLIVFCAGFATKPILLVLGAHQRNDLVNSASAVGLLIGFGMLYAGLIAGWSLWSLLWAQLAATIFSNVANFFQCLRLGLLPRFRWRDCHSVERLREVSSYGWQRIVATFGYTMLLATPTFLITRFLGLDATAAWTVGTRTQQLGSQTTSKVTEMAYPALAEMYVRGETRSLHRRYSDTLVVASSLAVFIGGIIAACNREFIILWTGGKIEWSSSLDLTLGLLLFVMIAQKIFWLPVSIAKDLGISRYMSLVEAGAAAAVVFLWPRDSFGILSVALALLVAGAATTLPVYVLRTASVLQLPKEDFTRTLVRLGIRMVLPVYATAFLLSTRVPASSWPTLVGKAALMSIVCIVCIGSLTEARCCAREFGQRFARKLGRKAA